MRNVKKVASLGVKGEFCFLVHVMGRAHVINNDLFIIVLLTLLILHGKAFYNIRLKIFELIIFTNFSFVIFTSKELFESMYSFRLQQ